MLAVFAAALFYGDSMITPAISVLSAVEGLELAAPARHLAVVPLTVAILVALFRIQRHGTARIGVFFGPDHAGLVPDAGRPGPHRLIRYPEVLSALSPHYAVAFMIDPGLTAFLALGPSARDRDGGAVTDMGHFGRLPIRLAWYLLVLPALMLNYFGQGALLLTHPESIVNPFFHLGPGWAGIPLVLLATTASVIASQAVISGAFSVTRQAMHLGYLPRMSIVHTSGDGDRADLHPRPQLDIGRLRAGTGRGLPDLDQPGVRLWSGGDRDDGDRHGADSIGHGAAVAVAPGATPFRWWHSS